MERRTLASTAVAATLIPLSLSVPAHADGPSATPTPSAFCGTANSVSLQASAQRVALGQPVTLTATVNSSCESDRQHSVSISQRRAGAYGPGGEGAPAPQPVGTVITPAGETATATVTVTPDSSTEYLYGETGKAYSQPPSITVYVIPPNSGACPYLSPTRYVAAPNSKIMLGLSSSRSDSYTTVTISRTSPAPVVRVIDRGTYGNAGAYLAVAQNSRFVVHEETGNPDCGDLPLSIDVQPRLTINATRNGQRTYTFQGRVTPGRAQRVTLYRTANSDGTGRRVITAQAKVGPDGTWTIRRRFTGSGRFGFQAAVPASSTNLAGASPDRPTLIY